MSFWRLPAHETEQAQVSHPAHTRLFGRWLSLVDLSGLSEHLVVVVQETMQPAHISLWLRSPEQRRTHQNTEEGGAR